MGLWERFRDMDWFYMGQKGISGNCCYPLERRLDMIYDHS